MSSAGSQLSNTVCSGVVWNPAGGFFSDGGRHICVVGTGDTRENAQADAYFRINEIKCSLNAVYYRKDIG